MSSYSNGSYLIHRADRVCRQLEERTLFLSVKGVAFATGRHSEPQLMPMQGLLPSSSALAGTLCPQGFSS